MPYTVEERPQVYVPYISDAAFLQTLPEPCACSTPETGCMILSDTGNAIDVTARCPCVVISDEPFCYVLDGVNCPSGVAQSGWAERFYRSDGSQNDVCYSSYEETPDQSANCDGKVFAS